MIPLVRVMILFLVEEVFKGAVVELLRSGLAGAVKGWCRVKEKCRRK